MPELGPSDAKIDDLEVWTEPAVLEYARECVLHDRRRRDSRMLRGLLYAIGAGGVIGLVLVAWRLGLLIAGVK